MRFLLLIFYLFLIFLGVSFAALNANSVHVNFYIADFFIPVSVLMALMVALGFLLGTIVSFIRYFKLKMEFLKIKNQLKLTEKEIKNLRAIPLTDQH